MTKKVKALINVEKLVLNIGEVYFNYEDDVEDCTNCSCGEMEEDNIKANVQHGVEQTNDMINKLIEQYASGFKISYPNKESDTK